MPCQRNSCRVLSQCLCVLCAQVREPQPLTLHHLPFSHTFALFEVRHLPAAAAVARVVLQLPCGILLHI
jgi:hypothetical protein